jgi:biopolymer transport protein ExbD
MLRPKKRKTSVGVFDLTPMIDVVLQLIIFFMFTSQFGQVSRTDVDLPNEPGEEERAEDKPTLIIDITLEGAYVIDARPLPFDRVLAIVEREADRFADPSAMTVLIRPDKRAAASAINRLADEFARLGVRRWAIATRSEGGGG